jgi:hypothetical protein
VDLAAQQLTIDVIGRVAFGIDMRWVLTCPMSQQAAQNMPACMSRSWLLAHDTALHSLCTTACTPCVDVVTCPSPAWWCCSATEFTPHTGLRVVSHLLKALQTRVNILNRMRPWCKVGQWACDRMGSTGPPLGI